MGCRAFSKHLFSKVHGAPEAVTRIRSCLHFLQRETGATLLQSVSLLLTDTSKSEIRSNCEFTNDMYICDTTCKDYRASPFRAHTPQLRRGPNGSCPVLCCQDRRASQVPNSGWTFLRISGKSLAKTSVGCCSRCRFSLCRCL